MACEVTIKIAPDARPIALTFWQGDEGTSARVDLTGLTLEVRGQVLPFAELPVITNAAQGEARWTIAPSSVKLMTKRYRTEIWAKPPTVEAYELLVIWLEPSG
jgi:hypothetical protein